MCNFLILFCTYIQIVKSNPHLLDRFFGKPVDESMDLFRNPQIYRYVYINEQPNRPKKSTLNAVHWDNLHPSRKNPFSIENDDFCTTSKWVIGAVTCVICLLFLVVLGHIIKNCIKKKRNYSELECQGDCGCEPGQCELCQNNINDF
ncbi:uncharacterized protein LOC113559275 [Rhopalosiphum maidis]|uniref:uncharacterized protein LOC113559275 n=1 Tax=Rhopalosiphum maidis TaxID=43146 RepID=UPI000EFFD9CB|nr:uncharacterized protein LOC113559275 [Rhopalosiphum maidis]